MSDCTPPAERMLRCLGMSGVTPTERIVLAVLAYHDGPGGARPAAERIGELARISRSRVFEVLGDLESKGRIRRKQWRGANRYTIAYGAPETVREFQTVKTVRESRTVSRTKPSGNPGGNRQGIPDTNRKEPEGSLCDPSGFSISLPLYLSLTSASARERETRAP